MRYFVEFSYLGKDYHGWQNQPNAITVQEVLEKAFFTLLRDTVPLVGAGRTDAGVHAKQMFAHFDFKEISDLEMFVYRLNALLPEAIAVQDVFEVNPDAHARFDAEERTYEYWVLQDKNPFYGDFSHYIKHSLDIEAMNEAAALLLQFKDFECFSKTHTDVKTYFCDVKEAVWELKEEKLVFTITADRFLRNMVRAVVGTLLEVGTGKIKPSDVKSIINSKTRSNAGPSVPAKGLYLTSVLYPKKITEKHG
ncbi:tRNA pseudouridine(38-40) synthase TruA [Zobellia uliginosa]|uniref:tRNA pseudouridine(38-40) synthase TruA n=1 Tax=Zobellia uliginosa TaxID=143224 RepID=UPI001C07823B|nr:tRNA pseudouridine(38-40) synthase TruA [Zobellia uliginosa]MBU2947170.1 tRNA pseudouridine(38-40) synthase TruA [Zobellia uliginosa]